MTQSVLFDKYRIVSKLGDGASADVYLVEHISLHTYRALKCIKKANPLGMEASKEAHILKNLHHPNIPLIYDVEEDETNFYIIEEYIPGESLKSFRQKTTFLQEETILNYGVQICELVRYLHALPQPVLHLDLKPENLIVKDHQLKLVDFGAAIYREEEQERKRIGTRGYASPEQYHIGHIDERSDLYSIGMLLFYLVSGCTFQGDTSYLANIDETGNCSGKLKKILNRCLKSHPSLRYHTVEQLQNHLVSCHLRERRRHRTRMRPLTIGIAGAQGRIGTTHAALLLTAYLNRHVGPCIYVERNDSGASHLIWNRYEMKDPVAPLLSIRDCNLYVGENAEGVPGNLIQVRDYGKYSADIRAEIDVNDVQILVLGAKEWEIHESERALEAARDQEGMLLAFNLVDGYLFREVQKNMNGREVFRIPYASDPFAVTRSEHLAELTEEIIRKGAKGETDTKADADQKTGRCTSQR